MSDGTDLPGTRSSGPAPDDHDLVRRCAPLVALLGERAAEAEERRQLAAGVLGEARAAGLLDAVVPTELGGRGLGVGPLAHATRTLAHGCPASAWTLSFLALHGWLLSRFGADGRAQLFADGPVVLAPAPLAPTGTAVPVDGGYRVTGRWEWATGVQHADVVVVHAIVDGPAFDTRFAVLPIAAVEVLDDWHTSGMRATGSSTVVVRDRFVPAALTLTTRALLDGAPADEAVAGDGLAGHPVPPVLALVAAAPALGAAEAAVAAFRDRLESRVLAYSLGDRQRDQPAAQVRLATAMSDLAATRLRWDHALATVAARAADGTVDEALRVDVRLTAAATVRASRAVISTVAEGAGASVYRSTSPLQRLQRDVEVLKGHVMFDWDRTAELAGRVALGGELRPTDLV